MTASSSVMSQQFGTRITREQAKALGIEDQVLAQLVAGAVLDEQASELGLGLSQDKLAKLTMEDPAFHGPDGRFNRQQFEYALRQIGMRPEDYLKNRAQVAIRQQIVEAVSDGMKAPDTFLRAVALYRGEDRTAEFIAAAEVAGRAHRGPVRRRALDLVRGEQGRLRRAGIPQDRLCHAAAGEHRRRSGDLRRAGEGGLRQEHRALHDARNAHHRAARVSRPGSRAGGARFDQGWRDLRFDRRRREGKTPADTLLGTFAKDKVADPAVAEAAFALQANEVSPIVDGAFGPVLVRVTEIKPEVVRPLAEVTPEIRKDLALAEANRILLDVHDSYEDSRAAGESLREAAAKLGLKVVTIDAIDRAAQRPDGTIVNDLPQSKELLERRPSKPRSASKTLRSTSAATASSSTRSRSITPARDRTLDEVKAKVVADWKAAETEKRLAAKAAELEKRLKDGATLDTLATELKLEKQTKRGLKRESDDADFGKSGVAVDLQPRRRRRRRCAGPDGRRPAAVQGDRGVRAGRRRREFGSRRRAEILRLGHGRRPARPAGGQASGALWRRSQPQRHRAGAGVLGR